MTVVKKRFEISIEKFDRPSECGILYVINGSSNSCGFGYPFTQEDWVALNVDEEIKRIKKEYGSFNCVVVSDFRIKQTKLFEVVE
jgi:hypothetical protein